MDDEPQPNDLQPKRSPRVVLTRNAQDQAGSLATDLGQIRIAINEIPMPETGSSSPRLLAETLICDAESLLEGIEHGTLTRGNSRIASNLIRAVELLEPGGRAFEKPIMDLQMTVLRLSQHGLTIDGQTLGDAKHTERLKS